MKQTLILFIVTSLSLLPCLLQGQKESLAKTLDPPPPPACGGAVGINLNELGTFGAGSTRMGPPDFYPASEYVGTTTLPLPPGSFTLTNSTANWPVEFNAPSWIAINEAGGDPTGYMMVVNGRPDQDMIASWEIDGLCAGISYEFSAAFANLLDSTQYADGRPDLEFLIDGQLLGATGGIPQDEAWHSFGFTFSPNGIQTSVRISLRNNSEGQIGNDFAIDNVWLRPCGPSLSLEEVLPMDHCLESQVEVAIGIGSGPAEPVIQWQVSQDEGENWQNFGTPSRETTLIIDQLPPDLVLRALVAEDEPMITRPSCRYISNVLQFQYLPLEDCPTTIIDTTLCAGQTVQVGGEIFHASGTFQVKLQDSNGLDSLVQLELTVDPPIQVVENIGLCAGDTYAGVSFTQDTTFSQVYSAINGCDSTHTVNIIVFPIPNPQINGPASLCAGNPDRLFTSGSFLQYEWSTGQVGPILDIDEPGVYGLTVTDDVGCVGEDSWEVFATQIKVVYHVTPPTCATATDGLLQIEQVAGGSGIYDIRLDGKVVRESTIAVPSGTFLLEITDSQGCRVEEQIRILPASPLALSVSASYEIFSGQSAELSFAANHPVASVLWTSSDSLDCATCASPLVSPDFTTRYQLMVQDDRGCTAEAQITVVVRQEFAYFAPNVFSPNGDGVNDHFSIFAGPEIQGVENIRIYNRWGSLVRDIKQSPPGAEIWDGYYQGQALPNGVYVYQGEIVGQNGQRQIITGEFMLLR